MEAKKSSLILSLIILITSICSTAEAKSNDYEITPLSHLTDAMISSEVIGTEAVEGLIETIPDDPNWVLVTSNAILRENLCYMPWYDRVFNSCYYNYGITRYWRLESGTSPGKAFPMSTMGIGTFDSLYVREGFGFQLYYNTQEPSDPCDLNPTSLYMCGPQYVSIDCWRDTYPAPDGFEPGTFFVSGDPGSLSNYSIIINDGCYRPFYLTKVDDVNDGDCVGPGDEINYRIDYYNPITDPCDPRYVGTVNDVDIIDYLPNEVDFNSASGPNCVQPDSNTVIWHIGTLHPGDAGFVTLKVNVRPCVEPSSKITNCCRIKSGDEVLSIARECTHVCSNIDDFDIYFPVGGATHPWITDTWKKSGCSATTISTATHFSDGTTATIDYNAMKIAYNNASSPWYSEVNYAPVSDEFTGERSIPLDKQNWSIGGVKILGIRVHGEPNNTLEKLYVTVGDYNNHKLTVYYPDSNEMKQQTNENWIWWVIDLQRFADAGVYLSKVQNLIIGIGDKASPGGSGIVYFDDIGLYCPMCLNQDEDADFNNDCSVNMDDFVILAEDWLVGSYQVTAAAPPSPDSNLVLWYQFDDEDGSYEIVDSSGHGYNASLLFPAPMVPGHTGNAFAFNGYESFIPVPVAAASDVNLGGHSTMTFWIKDNGQPEDKMLVQIGSLTNRGNVQVWSGWTGYYDYTCGEYPVTNYHDQVDWGRYGYTNPGHIRNQWNQYAFTKDHDDGLMRIYHNGYAVAEYREAFAEKMPAFRTSGTELDFFTIGAFQWSGTTSAPRGDYYKGSMDDFRLYKRALSDSEILYLYLNGAGSITQPVLSRADVVKDNRVNFEDLALMAGSWLEDYRWPNN